MITVKLKGAEKLTGFSLRGHGTENPDDTEGRIICSAVSSAVYLSANTLSEIVGAKLEVFDDGDVFSVSVKSKLEESQITLRGLELHLRELSKEYKNSIKIISEV